MSQIISLTKGGIGMNPKHQYLGIVEAGRFKLLLPDSMAGSYRRRETATLKLISLRVEGS